MSSQEFYTDPVPWAEAVATQFIASRDGMPDRVLISDADDTIIDSRLRWYNDYLRFARAARIPTENHMTLEEFGQSPRQAFTSLELVSDYDTYKQERMVNTIFHAGMVALGDTEKALATDMATLPHGYMSTRPASLGKVTAHNLVRLGFNRAPLMVRPLHIAYANTVDFKLDAISRLHDTIQSALPGTTVEYVDDYSAVTSAINAVGIDTLVGTHYGPHTSWAEILGQQDLF